MAVKYYYKSGGGNDNFATAANWYNGSGGTGGTTTAPGVADDCIVNSASNVTILTIAAVASIKSLDLTGFTGTLAGTSINTLTLNGADGSGNTLILGSGMTLTYNALITFQGTSITGYIYTNGKVIQGNVTFNGTGSSWTTMDQFVTLSTSTFTLTAGSLTSASGSYIVGLFVSTGAVARTISCYTVEITGIGTALNISGTNITMSLTYVVLTNASASTKTITNSIGIASIFNVMILGAGTGSYSITGNFYELAIQNSGGANLAFGVCNIANLWFNVNPLAGNPYSPNLAGPSVNSNVNWNSPTNIITFNTDGGTIQLSPSMTITTSPPITISALGYYVQIWFNGAPTLTSAITINGFGLDCADTFKTTGLLTLTTGTFSAGDAYIGTISTSNSNTRNFYASNLYLTGTGTLITASTTTGLTWITSSIYVTTASSIARTLTFNTIVYSSYVELGGVGGSSLGFAPGTTGIPRVAVTNTGAASISFSSGTITELIFSGGTNVVWANGGSISLTIQGDMTLVSTMGTITSTPALTFTALGYALSQNSRITLAGKSLVTGAVTLNDSLGPGAGNGYFTFVDAFSSNASVIITSCGITTISANFTLSINTNTFTFTSGILSVINGANIGFGLFTSTGSSFRSISMGSGRWNLTGIGTIWNLSSTNLALDSGKSRILINNTTVSAITFAGASQIYYTVQIERASGTGSVTFTGDNYFTNFIDNASTVGHSLIFAAASTNTFYKFNVKGTAGQLVVITSSTTGVFNFVKAGTGTVNCDYLNVAHSVATPASTWYAGANSTNTQATAVAGSGWIFTIPTSSKSQLGSGGVG